MCPRKKSYIIKNVKRLVPSEVDVILLVFKYNTHDNTISTGGRFFRYATQMPCDCGIFTMNLSYTD